MNAFSVVLLVGALAPLLCLLLLVPLVRLKAASAWSLFKSLSSLALLAATLPLAVLWLDPAARSAANGLLGPVGLQLSVFGVWLALLVQLLGTVIGSFSARYLQGEAGQARYVAALAGVLLSVQLLILADHWLVLVAAWTAVGMALQPLLCFYPQRPFAQLAAHKKRLADYLADALLLGAAALAWSSVGSGSLSDLWRHLALHGASPALQWSAVLLALAVIVRTALLPLHGWLIQVMEAPTPVSALLHAGVVNLGGYVLIRFAPLLEASAVARWTLVMFGLASAILAGLVLLTRVSIKVRLAWSTVAQMGFMVLECGLGLYTLAALHLLGHSIYKAHAFLSASSAVRQTSLQLMRGRLEPGASSLLLAPLAAWLLVLAIQLALVPHAWPWWWTAVLALAWAPLLWLSRSTDVPLALLAWQAVIGVALVIGLTLLAGMAHLLPFGVQDALFHDAGAFALLVLAVLYAALVLLQLRPQQLAAWRRWAYAGFYVDEFYTRLVLRLWPTSCAPAPARAGGVAPQALLVGK